MTPDTEPVHESMLQVFEQIKNRDNLRLAQITQDVRLYGNREFAALSPGSTNFNFNSDDLLKFNLVRSIVDTLNAKVGKNRPRPVFVTDEGKWVDQQRAKGMTRAVGGEFYRNSYYDQSVQIFRDACITGTGVLKVYEAERRVLIERVYLWELFVDAADCWYGSPRSLYQRKAIDRSVLAEMYPDSAADIEDASPSTSARDFVGMHSVADRLEVVEAWHLPSSSEAEDGRHVIAISGSTLLDEPWTRDTFPFAFLNYGDPQTGFWGTSLTEDIAPQQVELNLILEKTQEMISLNVPRTYVPRAARISKLHVSNVPGDWVEYSGMQPPIHQAPPGLPPEYMAYADRVKADAYEGSGISQLSASSRKPVGVDSGVALREMNDLESERYYVVGRHLEKLALDTAKLVIATIKEIVAEYGEYKIQALDERGRSATVIEWSTVDLDADSYATQLFPVGLLPTRPEARMQTVIDLLQAGIIDGTEAQMLLDFPDTNAASASRLAPYTIVDKAIYLMLNDGMEIIPEPFWNLSYALKQAQNQYCLTGMMAEPPPEENRELLRQFMTLTQSLMLAAEPPPVAPAPTSPVMQEPGIQPQ